MMPAEAQRPEKDAGFVLLLFVSILAGALLAGLGAVALVNVTARSTTPVGAPTVTYDAG